MAVNIAEWTKSIFFPGMAVADTTVPPSTRLLNPDFSQAGTFWFQYGVGSGWLFQDDGAETTIPALQDSADLVNSSGAPGTFSIRVLASLPVAGLTYSLHVYNPAGIAGEVLLAPTPMFGDDIVQVTQTTIGRIGIIIHNTTGAPIDLHMILVTTVVKTYLLYQPIPIGVESLRVRLTIPVRTGSIKVLIYAFNDPLLPFQQLLQEVNLVRNKDVYNLEVNVDSNAIYKYAGLYTVTDYDTTLISYFNVNSVISIWKHDQQGRTNNFFGVQYDSAIELVFNVQAGQVRIFNSLGIQSETAWSVESFVTSEGNLSALAEGNFRLRDGVYSAAIMRDILTPQDALPDPVNNSPIMHGTKLTGVWIKMILRNSETLRRIELRAVYLGSDELSGNLLAKK